MPIILVVKVSSMIDEEHFGVPFLTGVKKGIPQNVSVSGKASWE